MPRYKGSRVKRDKDAARKRGQRAYHAAIKAGKSEEEARKAQAAAKLAAGWSTGRGSGAGRRQTNLPPVSTSESDDSPVSPTGMAAMRRKLTVMIDNATTASEMNQLISAYMKLPPEPELTEPPYVKHLREQAEHCDGYIAIISAAHSIGVTEDELHHAWDNPLIVAARALLVTITPPEEEKDDD